MTPPVTNMDQKIVTMPQGEQAGPPVKRRRRGVWVAVSVVLAALILGGVSLGAVAIYKNLNPKENFEVGVDYGDRRLSDAVSVDYKRQIIYVTEERYGQLGGLSYLHHFDKRLTAIRDTVNNRCYLTPQESNFQGMVNWFSGHDGKTSSTKSTGFRFVPQSIDRDVLQSFGGKEIANHCRDLPAHWIVPLVQEYSLAQSSNRTVDFQCSEGEYFDPESFSCGVKVVSG